MVPPPNPAGERAGSEALEGPHKSQGYGGLGMLPSSPIASGLPTQKGQSGVLQHPPTPGHGKTLVAPETGSLGPTQPALKGRDTRTPRDTTPDLLQQF